MADEYVMDPRLEMAAERASVANASPQEAASAPDAVAERAADELAAIEAREAAQRATASGRVLSEGEPGFELQQAHLLAGVTVPADPAAYRMPQALVGETPLQPAEVRVLQETAHAAQLHPSEFTLLADLTRRYQRAEVLPANDAARDLAVQKQVAELYRVHGTERGDEIANAARAAFDSIRKDAVTNRLADFLMDIARVDRHALELLARIGERRQSK